MYKFNLQKGHLTKCNSGVEGQSLNKEIVGQHRKERHYNVHQGHVEDYGSVRIVVLVVIDSSCKTRETFLFYYSIIKKHSTVKVRLFPPLTLFVFESHTLTAHMNIYPVSSKRLYSLSLSSTSSFHSVRHSDFDLGKMFPSEATSMDK